MSTRVFAQTSLVDELKQNISSRASDIEQLEKEIAEYKIRIENVGNQKATLQNAVQTLDLSRAKLAKDIQLTQAKIDRAGGMITKLNDGISQKQQRIDRNKDLIADIIHRIDQTDSDTMLEILLSNTSLSSFLEDVDDMARMQNAVRDSILSLEQLKEEMSTSKASYLDERKKLTGLNTQLSDQKQVADGARKQQVSLLSATKNQESNYKKILAEREASKKQFEKEIDDFEAQIRVAIDPTSFPKPGTKVLEFPVEEPIITQRFGKTVDARRLYVSGTHNGTDFRATPGTIIKAAADGTVVATGDTDKACPGASYGRWILIKHKNGLSTLYGHLELIKVGAGKEVLVGDTIGYSGNTGYSTGPHLHFTVYVSSAVEVKNMPSKSCKGAIFRLPLAPANAYLDAMDYL
ncbi:MAG: Peptidase, M23/M37 family [Parcubacteria group bacterium GW2011_GWA2_47_7]|nr:MAG: Peptidase, M23/M37 family [Parcubacteria group bacterium GW2011_GWA2_47_7]